MSVGSLRHGYLYFPVPKCGSTSLRTILGNFYGSIVVGIDWYASELPPEYEASTSFTVVRNPYTRAISIWRHFIFGSLAYRYKYKAKDLENFGTFLKWLATRKNHLNRIAWTMTKHLADVPLDRIIRLENVEAGFKNLPFYNGDPKVFPVLNKSAGTIELTPTTRQLIYEIYAEDFERFGYAK
tara:strand:- start:179 stop:727 length:549 start_codon:yes stop_codon:yes gene_type:complete